VNRRKLREAIFKIVFSYEFDVFDNNDDQINDYIIENDIEEEAANEIRIRANDLINKLTNIDKLINEKTKNWSTERIGKVELAIVRVAVYEILYDENTPNSIAINEAVELSKEYGGDQSKVFINGILANFVK
jgi:N utilization substance protein B